MFLFLEIYNITTQVGTYRVIPLTFADTINFKKII